MRHRECSMYWRIYHMFNSWNVSLGLLNMLRDDTYDPFSILNKSHTKQWIIITIRKQRLVWQVPIPSLSCLCMKSKEKNILQYTRRKAIMAEKRHTSITLLCCYRTKKLPNFVAINNITALAMTKLMKFSCPGGSLASYMLSFDHFSYSVSRATRSV